MKYTYSAITAHGKSKHGTLDAASEMDAIGQLKEWGLMPVKLKEASALRAQQASGKKIWELEIMEGDIHKAKIPAKRMVMMFNQLAIMLRAGVRLSMALEVMYQTESNRKIKKILGEMQEDLLAGVMLSDSMAKFQCFDRVSVNIVRAGEADGHLERSFAQIATLSEKTRNLSSKIKSASIYPCILLVLVVAVLVLMNTTILPAFIPMFEALDEGVPFFTQLVMDISSFFTRFWWVLVLVVLLIVFGYRFARKKSEAFCVAVDRVKLKIPVIGKVTLNSQVAQFSRVLATLLESGQDFITGLITAQNTLKNAYMRHGLTKVEQEVRLGVTVSAAMGKMTFFSALYISMLRAGEESGSMSETLDKMAEMYEAEAEESTKRLTTMMEPAMTLFVAGIVGVVVIAIVIPMFSMFNMVGNI